MNNEEHIEEILFEASSLNIRHEVLELSKELRETNVHLNRLDSIQLAYIELSKSINQ